MPRKSVSDVLQLVNDYKRSVTSGSQNTAETKHFPLKAPESRFRKYVDGCMRRQPFKDSNQKIFNDVLSLELPGRRWGSFASDFMLGPKHTRMDTMRLRLWSIV